MLVRPQPSATMSGKSFSTSSQMAFCLTSVSRFFPPPGGSSDRSGNAPAGLVIDREITSPGSSSTTFLCPVHLGAYGLLYLVEFDFYLQSHGG